MPGLHSSTLLEQRIKEFSIPEWPWQPSFDRVILFRIPDDYYGGSETAIKGGSIIMPSSMQSDRKRKSPKMVLVAAGLQALDNLRSYGIELGHIVIAPRYGEWVHTVEERMVTTDDGSTKIEGIGFTLSRDVDIAGSEDLKKELTDGSKRIEVRDGKHQMVILEARVERQDGSGIQVNE